MESMTETCTFYQLESTQEGGDTYGQVIDVSSIDEHVSFVTERRKETCETHRSSDVTPSVPRRVDFHARVSDVGRVAEEGKPPVGV